jgi:hypothetical protein
MDVKKYVIDKNLDAINTTLKDILSKMSGGGEGETSRGVRFLDYDGTVVKTYTADAFAGLAALPANPSHAGLTAQGWNWSLEDAKAYVAKYGMLDIGQMYITDDGATRLYIHIATEGRMDVPLNFGQTVDGGVSINWGDGSATETVAGTGNKTVTHTYAAVGDYIISLLPAEGCTLTLGTGNNSILYSTRMAYGNMLQQVNIGKGVASIGNSAFQNCYSLSSVVIPEGVTSIGGSAFYYCSSLSSVVIPEGVASIGNSAFQNCYSLGIIRFEAATPPTANANAWSSVPTDCKIYVPAASLEAYKAAANYPNPATYTYIGY